MGTPSRGGPLTPPLGSAQKARPGRKTYLGLGSVGAAEGARRPSLLLTERQTA